MVGCTLHVVLAATQCFDLDLLNTVVQVCVRTVTQGVCVRNCCELADDASKRLCAFARAQVRMCVRGAGLLLVQTGKWRGCLRRWECDAMGSYHSLPWLWMLQGQRLKPERVEVLANECPPCHCQQ